MVMKNGKKVPFYAADGIGKMNMGGMMKKKSGMHKMPDGTMMKDEEMGMNYGGMVKKKKPAAKMMSGGMVKKKKPAAKMMSGGMAKKKMAYGGMSGYKAGGSTTAGKLGASNPPTQRKK